jgi:hypothetical protein
MQDCEASDGVATTNMTNIDTAITAIGMGHSALITDTDAPPPRYRLL